MDDQGWVPVTLIASFPRVSFLMIKQLTFLFTIEVVLEFFYLFFLKYELVIFGTPTITHLSRILTFSG